MRPVVVINISSIETLGQEQYKMYRKERLDTKVKLISDVLSRNRLSLFSSPVLQLKTKHQMIISLLKKLCSLFTTVHIYSSSKWGFRLFCWARKSAMSTIIIRIWNATFGVKLCLTKILELRTASSDPNLIPEADASLVDGAAMVNQLRPNGTCKTFQDYARQCYIPHIVARLKNVLRIDLVWDIYLPKSIRSRVRDKRGSGQHVHPRVNLPSNCFNI